MPVYNAGIDLIEAVQSILDQTFTDFEFVIVNDGSTDNSMELLQKFNDSMHHCFPIGTVTIQSVEVWVGWM